MIKRRVPAILLLLSTTSLFLGWIQAANRIVYPQAAVGPLGKQVFEIELRLANLDPNRPWNGRVRLLAQHDLTGMDSLEVSGPGDRIDAENGSWTVEIGPKGSIHYQVQSAGLQVGVLVIDSESSSVGEVVPSFFYRLREGSQATDLIAVQPERQPALAYNAVITQKEGFGVGLAIVSDSALDGLDSGNLPSTEITLTITLESGERLSQVINLGGSEAAQKAVFPSQLIPGLPSSFEAAHLSVTASHPVYVTLLGVGSPPVFQDVQIGAAPAEQQSNNRFKLSEDWVFAETGADLMTDGLWGCSSSTIVEYQGGFLARAEDEWATNINQTGPRLEVQGDFSVLASLNASSSNAGSLVLVGKFATGPEWWRGLRRMDVGLDRGQLFVHIFINQSTPEIHTFLEPHTLQGRVQIEIRRSGVEFEILADGNPVGVVGDKGLFTEGRVYLGTNVGPGNEMTVYGLAVSVPKDQLANAKVVVPRFQETVPVRPDSLRESAFMRGLSIGTAANQGSTADDSRYRDLLGGEFNTLTPENEMKWASIHPSERGYNFCPADQLTQFAHANQMDVRGHVLVWHSQNPAWLEEGDYTRDELIAILREHIMTVVGRYRGVVEEWDVINEAVEWDGSLRRTLWLDGIGPEYIEMAFLWAHQADPAAHLFYNDYSIAGRNLKSDGVFRLVQDLMNKGIPIHGVGFQGHVGVEPGLRPSKADVVSNIRRFNDLGLQVVFTEVDVRLRLPASQQAYNQQADVYRELLEACLESTYCPTFVVWGFTDRYSWVPSVFPGYGDALLFDRDYAAKPAYTALRELLQVD